MFKDGCFETNSVVGREGLYQMLLVFSPIPKPIRNSQLPGQLERSGAIGAASKEVEKEQAKVRIAFCLKNPSSPKAKESTSILHAWPAGEPALVYRTSRK